MAGQSTAEARTSEGGTRNESSKGQCNGHNYLEKVHKCHRPQSREAIKEKEKDDSILPILAEKGNLKTKQMKQTIVNIDLTYFSFDFSCWISCSIAMSLSSFSLVVLMKLALCCSWAR